MIIHDLEQGSEEWLQKRAGIPTASNFSNLVTSTGSLSKSIDKYAISLHLIYTPTRIYPNFKVIITLTGELNLSHMPDAFINYSVMLMLKKLDL
jgi:hypothetical protein